MIEIQNLSKNFGEKKAVIDLTLEIKPGEILGFLGSNGAGKTTTVKMLTGMLIPASGTAKVAGFDILAQPLEVKKRIGYIPESGALFESLTAWEYLELIANLHHLDQRLARGRIEELLTLFRIFDEKDNRLQGFSKGMKQKVLITAAFLHNPQVLFLDESLTGLDANAALIIKELLKKFAAQGKTIMFCSHILEVVERICSRIAIIHEGVLIIHGTTTEITQNASATTFEQAFGKLTGVQDVGVSTLEFLKALEQV